MVSAPMRSSRHRRSWREIELVVVNDESTDASLTEIERQPIPDADGGAPQQLRPNYHGRRTACQIAAPLRSPCRHVGKFIADKVNPHVPDRARPYGDQLGHDWACATLVAAGGPTGMNSSGAVSLIASGPTP